MVIFLAAAPAGAEANDSQEQKREAQAENRVLSQSLLKTHAPMVVTVKFVVSQEFMGQKNESESEVVGALVTDDGLVVVANSSLDPFGGDEPIIMGGPPGMDMPMPKSKAGDFRIIVGDDLAESEAQLVARDSDLDLAWLKIMNSNRQEFPHLDLDNSIPLQVGDSYHSIMRLPERFDRAAIIQGGSVIGEVVSPRLLHVAAGGTGPVFSDDGKLAGFLVRQPTEEGSPSIRSEASEGVRFIISADQLAQATKQAIKVQAN